VKTIIQIPCFNEENSLPLTLADLPRQIDGIDEVEWLIIDDGSRDNTVNVAIEHGIDYVVQHPSNLGLARAFETGLLTSIELGADIIVNTDADNQYRASDIPKLIVPILEGKAEYVIGSRPISDIKHFSPIKRLLQGLGSIVVRFFSGTQVKDAPSGFRAISRHAAMRLRVYNQYTYTLETIIQAGQSGVSIISVPVGINDPIRESRLISSTFNYLRRSIVLILRSFMIYKPLSFFLIPASILFTLSLLLGFRYLYFYFFLDGGVGHLQSLILTVILFTISSALVVTGLLADLISINRKILENLSYRQHRMEHKQSPSKSDQSTNLIFQRK
jgi:glycosyltransferase involved in cell wall biosynthesis